MPKKKRIYVVLKADDPLYERIIQESLKQDKPYYALIRKALEDSF